MLLLISHGLVIHVRKQTHKLKNAYNPVLPFYTKLEGPHLIYFNFDLSKQ